MDEKKETIQEETFEDEEFELNHTDKLVGIFTEPKSTFEKISKFPPKVTDWFIPLILLVAVSVFSNVIMMSNPAIKFKIIEEQTAKMEKQFDKAVEEGKMTREEADEQLEKTREFMEGNSAFSLVMQTVGTVIALFLFFFLVSFVFHLLAKLILKGEGTYSGSMVAYGLPFYISIIMVILMVLAGMATDRLFTDLSVASFLGMDKHTIAGFLLGKLDVFSIWYYGVFAIGLAKMHNSDETKKYLGLVYGTWLGFSLLIFILSQTIPFFKYFIR